MSERDVIEGYAQSRRVNAENALKYLTEVASIERQLKETELRVMTDVANAVDEGGKALFSNAEKRQAEVNARLAADAEYTSMKATAEDFRLKASTEQIWGQYHADMIRIYCAVCQATD